MKTVLAFMLPEDTDYHMDKDGNILIFNRLDELASYCDDNNIPLDDVNVFDVEVLDD